MAPFFSVIIPHLNQPEYLAKCLDSLDNQIIGHQAFEVIVVDNGSTSFFALTSIIAQHPNTQLLAEPAPGPGLARNRGVKTARGEVLAFIDADCRAHYDWLKNAMQSLRPTADKVILGGDVRIWRETEPMSAIEAYESVFSYRFKLYIEQHGYSGTGNLIVRKSDYEAVGPFGGIDIEEDSDWGRRARAAGYTFAYVPEMIVFHPARKTLPELLSRWERFTQHAVNVREPTVAWYARWFARAFAVGISPVIDWTKVVGSDRLKGVTPRLKAIGLLAVVRAYRAYRMVWLAIFPKNVQWNR